ncbi:MAG: hypothetical protein AB7S26_12735 [Sandaracinaceae bacterium]
MRRRLLALSVVVATGSLGAATVRAQDRIDEAVDATQEARFEDAERLYSEAAAASDGLDRDAVLRILRGRATVRSALQNVDGARSDLSALLALDPAARFDNATPSMRRLVEEVRPRSPPLGVEIEASHSPRGFEIASRVVGGARSVVRTIRVRELGPAAAGTIHEGERVTIPGDGELRYVVEVIGWGGAVLLREGSLASPRIAREGGDALSAPADGDDTGVWIGVGVGAGIAIAVAVVLAVTLSPSGRTQLRGPIEGAP